MIDTSSSISDFSFENPLMNASGVNCYDKDDLDQISSSLAGAFVTKSATLSFREGNPSPRYAEIPLGSINSMGLPNLGLDFYLNYSIDFQRKNPSKVNFISISGMTLEENLAMLKKIRKSEFHGLTEINLSCPNLPGKQQTGYDFKRTEEVLKKACEIFEKPLGVKLPPYFDMNHFEQVSDILNRFDLQYVNCINSVGNGLYIDPDTESVVIKPKEGFGGIGGACIKPTALANVRAFYKLLRPGISVIGCGGVETGRDVFEHLLCGAQMVQVGSSLARRGISCIGEILVELKEIMKKKGYKSIADFRGKLKTL